MAYEAKLIVYNAATLLQDLKGIRWPATTLVRHLNDAQRAIAMDRPDVTSKLVPTSLVAGALQTIPSDGLQLIDIAGNSDSKIALRKVDQSFMDALIPGWQGSTPSKTIKHFMWDQRFPRSYYVYPPAADGAKLDIVYSAYPVDIPAPSGATWDTVTGNIGLADQWANSLLDYVLHRAWDTDAQFGGNQTLSMERLQMFRDALKSQSAAAAAPTN